MDNELLDAALRPCEHRTDVPCARCEMARRREIFDRHLRSPAADGASRGPGRCAAAVPAVPAQPRPIDEHDATSGGDVLPERIVLDDASFEAFSADVSDPEPNAGLRDFFDRANLRKGG